ncbi:MAG: DUF2004 domain-containing protein [Thermoplasmata archaeon]
MHRGVEVGIYLRPDVHDDNFVATALANLAAFRLQEERHEHLEWQVVRVEGSAHHHYRLILRHPDRVLDLGFRAQLERTLDDLSNETVDRLRERLRAAEAQGLRLAPLRRVPQEIDYWKDDFWNWLG